MSLVTDKKDLENLRESGRRLSRILYSLEKECVPGASSIKINKLAEGLIREGGDDPIFLGYTPHGANRPFPAALCLSINNEIVHGIPNEKDKILQDGDIVGLDLGLSHNGMITDMAITVPVGHIDEESQKLLDITREALKRGINAARAGARIGDIGFAIESAVHGTKFEIVEELGGHGVGYKVHDEPFIANYGEPKSGPKIVPGMVLALEPIINMGSKDVILDSDGYTFKTEDGKRSAQFEHTILITKEGTEIITKV